MADDGWEPVNDPAEIRKVLGSGGGARNGAGLSIQDNKALNEMRGENAAALSVNRDYREVAKTLDRANLTPAKAKWLETWIPRENGGVMDAIGGYIGEQFLAPQTVSDFQTLRSLQSKRVMDAQIAQKGPQTEADAARLQLAEVSPFKTKQANIGVMRRGMADATIAKRKLPFFQVWANKYGLNGLNERGQTADQAWRGVSDAVYKTGDKLGQKKSQSIATIKDDSDYDRLPSGARFVGPDGKQRVKP